MRYYKEIPASAGMTNERGNDPRFRGGRLKERAGMTPASAGAGWERTGRARRGEDGE